MHHHLTRRAYVVEDPDRTGLDLGQALQIMARDTAGERPGVAVIFEMIERPGPIQHRYLLAEFPARSRPWAETAAVLSAARISACEEWNLVHWAFSALGEHPVLGLTELPACQFSCIGVWDNGFGEPANAAAAEAEPAEGGASAGGA